MNKKKIVYYCNIYSYFNFGDSKISIQSTDFEKYPVFQRVENLKYWRATPRNSWHSILC